MTHTTHANTRMISFATLKALKEYSTEAFQATLDTKTDVELTDALQWCARRDRADRRERFIFCDPDGKPFTDATVQRTSGTYYFDWLNSFRHAVEHVLARRAFQTVLAQSVPTPLTDARYEVAYDRYTAVCRIGKSERFQTDDLIMLTRDQLVHLYRWLTAIDKQFPDQLLVFLDADGTPVADDVQRLYGWRFFTYINQAKEAVADMVMTALLLES